MRVIVLSVLALGLGEAAQAGTLTFVLALEIRFT
jgi:hypothetical protein